MLSYERDDRLTQLLSASVGKRSVFSEWKATECAEHYSASKHPAYL